MSDYIAAIDLGTTKVVALVGKKTDYGRYQITASYEISSDGIQRGEVQNIIKVTELIKTVVDEVKSISGHNFSEIYVGIAGQHIHCTSQSHSTIRKNTFTEITKDEIDDLQNQIYSLTVDHGNEILHVIPQSYNVDEKMDIIDPVGMLGQKITGNYQIIESNLDATKIVMRCVKGANLSLNRLILEPLASAAAVLDDDEKELGVALVDIGGGTTDLVIYYDGIVRHTAVIPFGGNVVTEDIREGCGVLRRQAESMKKQFGTCLGELDKDDKIITIPGVNGRESKEITIKNLSRIIDARMEEIIGAVMFEIENSGYSQKLNAGIVFTGGGSNLKNFGQFTKLKTGYDVRIGKPMYLSTDSGNELAEAAYSTAVGLIIKGCEYEESKLNKNPNMNTMNNLFETVEMERVAIDLEMKDGKKTTKNQQKKQKQGFFNKVTKSISNFQTRIFDEEENKA